MMHGLNFWGLILINSNGYLIFATILSIFLFGSIYFKTKAFIKTIAAGSVFSFGFSIYALALVAISFGGINNNTGNLYINNTEYSTNIDIVDSPFWQTHYYIIPIALIVFFLSLTYLRLRETEV
jgi:hypothetical protein